MCNHRPTKPQSCNNRVSEQVRNPVKTQRKDGTQTTGSSCRAKPWPQPDAGCWMLGQCSTGRSGRTTRTSEMSSATHTARLPGRGITRPPRSLCCPGFRTSTMGSTFGSPPRTGWWARTSYAMEGPRATTNAWGTSPRSRRNGRRSRPKATSWARARLWHTLQGSLQPSPQGS